MRTIKALSIVLGLALGMLAAPAAAQYYPDRDYPSDYGSRRDYDDRYYGDTRGGYESQSERRLERERERLDDERARFDAQRLADEQARIQQQQQQQNAAKQQQSCPSGFSPSEQKCSAEERKRGCKDMRLPSGLGCVKR